ERWAWTCDRGRWSQRDLCTTSTVTTIREGAAVASAPFPPKRGWSGGGTTAIRRRQAMNAEIAIRGGLVVDGSGGPPVRADVGIDGGRFVEISATVKAPPEVDASGAIVCPGFIDIHTHYDPQVLWDPFLTPSS